MELGFRLAKELGDFSSLMRGYNNLTAVLADQASDYQRAELIVREGLELAQRAGARSHVSWLMGSLGDGAFRLGRLEEAEALQREALELALEVGDEPLRGMRLSVLAGVVLFRGRPEEAELLQRESIRS